MLNKSWKNLNIDLMETINFLNILKIIRQQKIIEIWINVTSTHVLINVLCITLLHFNLLCSTLLVPIKIFACFSLMFFGFQWTLVVPTCPARKMCSRTGTTLDESSSTRPTCLPSKYLRYLWYQRLRKWMLWQGRLIAQNTWQLWN